MQVLPAGAAAGAAVTATRQASHRGGQQQQSDSEGEGEHRAHASSPLQRSGHRPREDLLGGAEVPHGYAAECSCGTVSGPVRRAISGSRQAGQIPWVRRGGSANSNGWSRRTASSIRSHRRPSLTWSHHAQTVRKQGPVPHRAPPCRTALAESEPAARKPWHVSPSLCAELDTLRNPFSLSGGRGGSSRRPLRVPAPGWPPSPRPNFRKRG